jgi:alpha-glucosidase
MRMINIYICLLIFFVLHCSVNNVKKFSVKSPDKRIIVNFELKNNTPYYSVYFSGKEIIKPSKLGFKFKLIESLNKNLVVKDYKESTFNDTWEQPWGEKRYIENNYNQLKIFMEEKIKLKRRLNIIFRVFNDGIGFRYEIPQQENLDSIRVIDEGTEFVLTDNHTAWWIPAYRDNRYEFLYTRTTINEMDTVHTPLTIKSEEGYYLAIHEADLKDYASMTLVSLKNNTLKCDLVPWANGIKVKGKVPIKTPWRTIQIAEKSIDLVTSYLILNLNEPCILEDISWVKPNKYIGIWWGMHIGKYTFFEGENHGASLENAKMYIDFASKYKISLLLIEGWNKGWTPQWYLEAMPMFSFTESTPDFDLPEVCAYAQSRGVNLIGYHETGSNLVNYLKQIDDGMSMYKKLGIHDIKIGQVGSRLNMKEWHHGQSGVNYYRYVLKKAAEYQLAVNFHEPIKDTGERRTYPNMMTREGARGQEYNAWSSGNPPEHTVILPFTRMLCSPMDFTPGILDVTIKERRETRVHTTVAKQLALYVIFYSPIQMLADLPENYEGHPAFQFLLDVPCDWEDTQVLNGEIGDYLTIIRKDRNGDDWYLGSITNENKRIFEIDCSFLEEGKKYIAEIYADGADADWETNPLPVSITKMEVDRMSKMKIKLARGGGQAIRFHTIE